MVEQALANRKAATELDLEESTLPEWSPAFLTTFDVAQAYTVRASQTALVSTSCSGAPGLAKVASPC